MNDYEIETDEYLKHGINLFQHALFAPTEVDHIRIYNHYVKPRGVVVDLGCGIGETAHLLSRVNRGCEFINVTNSHRQAQAMQDMGRNFVFSDFHATPLPDRCADFVLINESYGYADPARLMKEISRLLKPGGFFVLKDFIPAKSVSKSMKLDEWEYTAFSVGETVKFAEKNNMMLAWMFRPTIYIERFKDFFEQSMMKKWHELVDYPTWCSLMKFEKVAE